MESFTRRRIELAKCLPDVVIGLIVEVACLSIPDIVRVTSVTKAWASVRQRQLERLARLKQLPVPRRCRGSLARKLVQLEAAKADLECVDSPSFERAQCARRKFAKYPLNVVSLYAARAVRGIAGFDERSLKREIALGNFDIFIQKLPRHELETISHELLPSLLDVVDLVKTAQVTVLFRDHPHRYMCGALSVLPKLHPDALAAHLPRLVASLEPLLLLDAQHAAPNQDSAVNHVYRALFKIHPSCRAPYQPFFQHHLLNCQLVYRKYRDQIPTFLSLPDFGLSVLEHLALPWPCLRRSL